MFILRCILVSSIIFLLSTSLAYSAPKSLRIDPLSNAERQSTDNILNKTSLPQRCAWYKKKLGKYSSLINQEAKRNQIPPNLLATVVLNELADIGVTDVSMDQVIAKSRCNYARFKDDPNSLIFRTKRLGKHSLGIAQITPETALKHRAIRVPSNLKGEEKDFYIACRLLDRPTSIATAAKIVRSILVRMERVRFSPAIEKNVRQGESFSASQPYRSLGPKTGKKQSVKRTKHTLRRREMKLAELVTMTYNSGRSLTMSTQEYANKNYYKDARTHGDNGSSIGADFFEAKGCGLGLKQWKHKITADIKKPAKRDYNKLRNCLCSCHAVGNNFSCSFNTKDKGHSPSCRKISNGNCICKANGCFRKPPVTSGKCYNKCVSKYGNP